ncbi:uncharacterized protein At4g14100-like [Macadamia integrifolia]|uniref:uncharacterized protein At4g14100-like n=1 Tax=Macadamia integrifolia TaxID=60698 RepID=UPI001C5316CA|nr:uncharacterized protein At4g14100-like [Macadamia integrifolia]
MKLLELLLILGLFQFHQLGFPAIQPPKSSPAPSPWPEQFHMLLYMNLSSGHLQITDLWYDWPKGRNVNIMQKQLGELLYDVEWDNGTSFYYTLGANGACRTVSFEVGIPRPDWLEGANYVGRDYTDGFLCNVWEKVDFIWYYEDVVTKIPVRWDFYDGISTHVMKYEVGAALEDSQVQAPVYCFQEGKEFLSTAFQPPLERGFLKHI